MKIAFAGTGYINKVHAQAAKNAGLALTAVVNHGKDSMIEFGKQFNIARQYKKLEDLLKDGGVDALVISTPNYLHAPQTIAALTEPPADLMKRGGAYYSTLATQLINSHHNDLGQIHVVNVRNNGAVKDWPADWVLELPAKVDKRGALDAEGVGCWVGYEAMRNYELFQPQKSNLAVPKAFPEYFDFSKMGFPVATRACEHEAVWLDESIFRAGTKGVDDAVAAIKKIQRNAEELNKAADELKKKYGK